MVFLNCTNHKMSSAQVADATKNLRVERFAHLSEASQKKFSQVPCEPELNMESYASPILKEIMTLPKGSYVMCQGEHTLTYHLVSRLLDAGYQVVAAVSKRETVEKDGVKTSVFFHKGFRFYK